MAKIIVADDEPFMQAILGDVLREHKGHNVTICDNGRDLVEKVREAEGRYDLGFFDRDMPQMSGTEATRIIRQLGYNFPIWLISARDTYQIKEEGDKAGITGYLQKPFNIENLLRVVDDVLEPSHEDGQAYSEKQ